MKRFTGIVWIIVVTFIVWIGYQYRNGQFTPEMRLAKKLDDTWVMLDSSWQDECNARNTPYGIRADQLHFRSIILNYFDYYKHNKTTHGSFSVYKDPQMKYISGSVRVSGDNILTFFWRTGNIADLSGDDVEQSFRVHWQNDDFMGLQDATTPNGPIRWYRRE